MPDAPTRFERVSQLVRRPAQGPGGCGRRPIVVIVLAAIVRELAMGGIAIDPVVVKATDAPDAPTPDLAAQQIARQLDRIQRSGVQERRRLHVDDGIRPVDLQIPGAPISVRNAAREVVALFGLAPVTLRSALMRRGRWQVRGGDEPGGRPWVDGQLSDGGRRHARQHLRMHRLQRDRFHRSPDGSVLHVQARTGGMQRSRYGARRHARPASRAASHQQSPGSLQLPPDTEAHCQDDEQHQQVGSALGALLLRPDPLGARHGVGRSRPSAAAL